MISASFMTGIPGTAPMNLTGSWTASDGKEQINTKIDKTIRQMESGSESSKHAANVLSNLSRQLDRS
jgi:hypothetical protein